MEKRRNGIQNLELLKRRDGRTWCFQVGDALFGKKRRNGRGGTEEGHGHRFRLSNSISLVPLKAQWSCDQKSSGPLYHQKKRQVV